MWRAAAASALLLILAGTGASAAAPPELNFACSPGPSDCGGWYRTAVTLSWDWNDISASPTDGDCASRFFSSDTPGTRVFCEVTTDATGEYTGRPLTIHVDQTPPRIAAVPARPPDHAGWFNHPVRVQFAGTDATSGVRSCSAASYGGPDAAGISLSGTCTDVAGNTGSSSFGLNYDATPPAAAKVTVVPGNRRMALSWQVPVDAVFMQVARVTGDGSTDLLHQGAEAGFTDRGLRNGRRHRYLITSVDRAGNRASARATGVPTRLPLLSPAAGARLSRPPLLMWKDVRRARYYNVQLYRGGRKILTRWPRGERLQVAKRWRFAGHERQLGPGRYEWFVFPGFGSRSERRYGKLLGSSRFTVTR